MGHVLVAGATGQLGRCIVRELAARGHRVRALTRRPTAIEGAELAVADATRPETLPVGVLLRTELEAESTYRSWVELGSPTVARARERLAAEGYRGPELEEEVRKSVYELRRARRPERAHAVAPGSRAPSVRI